MKQKCLICRVKRLCWATLLLALMAGCASGPRFSAVQSIPPDKALVYIYRPKQVVGLGGIVPVNSPWRIYLNKVEPTNLNQDGYCVYFAPAGTNVFTVARIHPVFHYELESYNLLHTNLTAASVYYFKFDVGAFRPHLLPVESAVAAQEIAHYKLESPKAASK